MANRSVYLLGLWGSILSSIFAIFLTVTGILRVIGILSQHWSNILVCVASLLLAISFLAMMIAVHYVARDERKIWSHAGVAFAILYTALVSIVYIVLLFLVEPSIIKGQTANIAPFIFTRGTFTQIVDGLGYAFMSMATLFAAPVFRGERHGIWVYGFFLANGLMALPVLISYLAYNILLGLPWAITLPGATIALAGYLAKNYR